MYTVRHDTLQIYALEEIIQNYKNKWHNHILRTDTSRLTKKLRITNQTEEEMLDDLEDDGTEQGNESLP
jgi:hypothetical protein